MNTTQPDSLIYIVDDEPAVRESLSLMLEMNGFQVKCIESAKAFLTASFFEGISCAIVDVRMPDMNGLQLQQALIDRSDLLPIIFLTGFGDIPMSVRAIKAGALDFLTKPITQEKLLNCVRAALEVSARQCAENKQRQAFQARLDTLTRREREVMALVIDGQSNKDIARLLDISHRTVEQHRSRLMEKIGVNSVLELVTKYQSAQPERPDQ